MAWLTAEEMHARELTPLNVYDANGICIYRKITGFDAETGEVESFVLDDKGKYIIEGEECRKRIEKFPAPLTYRKISSEERDRSKAFCWDLQGK